MPKNYPAFIIDRCRKLENDGMTYDYVACTDKTVGFIARAYSVRRAAAEQINAYIHSFPPEVAEVRFIVANYERISVVLEIIEFMQNPALDMQERGRIKSLLKKAARKYMAYIGKTEVPDVSAGHSISNQIKAIEDVIATAESQREKMEAYMGAENTDFYIECLKASLKSLSTLKRLQEAAQ